MIEKLRAALGAVTETGGMTVGRDYETVRDDAGNLVRDDDGKPVRDSRDLPPATEPSHLSPSVDVPIARGREIDAANDRPDTTYKVAHLSLDVECDLDDTFGQYKAVLRRKGRKNPKMDAHVDLAPDCLTDLELVKRLETNMRGVIGRLSDDADVERVNPLVFRFSNLSEVRRREIKNQCSACLCHLHSSLDFYRHAEDEDGNVYVWARHVYSYGGWRDEVAQFDEMVED